MRWRIATVMALAHAALAWSVLVPRSPRLVWNTTASAPIGLYAIVHRHPRPSDLVLVDLPPSVRAIAIARGYLAPRSLLIKRLAAAGGDRVCRLGRNVWISSHKVVVARLVDPHRRPLPTWHGCRVLAGGQLFVLGVAAGSFDSRYFGPIDRRYLFGIAIPILTFRTRFQELPGRNCALI